MKNENRVLGAILVLAALMVFGFANLIPVDNDTLQPLFRGLNPDENSHLSYIKLLIENHGLVRFPFDAITYDPSYAEAHQPPLYYWLCIPFYLMSGGNPLILRLVNLPIHLLTIFVAFKAGKNLFPDRREIALGVAAFIAFLPTQLQLAGAINNDSLATLFAALLFWKMARVVKKGVSKAGIIQIGVCLGLGLWTKLTFLQLIPAIFVAYAMAFFMPKTEGNTKKGEVVRALVLAIGLGLLIASPWLIRNTMLYGDPFCLKIFPKTAPPNTPTPTSVAEIRGVSLASIYFFVFVRSFGTYFFILPPNAFMKPMLPVFLLLLLLSIIGIVGAWIKEKESESRRLVALATLTAGLLVPFFIAFNLKFFQAQGRYFSTALLPLTLIQVLGIANLTPKVAREWILFSICLFLLVLSIGQMATLDMALMGNW